MASLTLDTSSVKRASGCEFCGELAGDADARFPRLYRGLLHSRVVDREQGFVAIPTIGQLFPGSLLILPEQHFETTASAQAVLGFEALGRLVARMSRTLRRFGEPVLFEHGARESTGGACGIYHAHVHLVPVPESVSLGEILPHGSAISPSLADALGANAGCDEYLLARDTDGRVGYVQPGAAERDRYPSQYLRRFLVERFDLHAPWDWRASTGPEPHLLSTIARLQER